MQRIRLARIPGLRAMLLSLGLFGCTAQSDTPEAAREERLVLIVGEDERPVFGFTNMPSLAALSVVADPDWTYWGYGESRSPNLYIVSTSTRPRPDGCLAVPKVPDADLRTLCQVQLTATIPRCELWRSGNDFVARSSVAIMANLSLRQQAILSECLVFAIKQVGGRSVATPQAEAILQDYVRAQ